MRYVNGWEGLLRRTLRTTYSPRKAVLLTAGVLKVFSLAVSACSGLGGNEQAVRQQEPEAAEEDVRPEVPDVAGTWKGDVEDGGTATLRLRQEGARLSGSLTFVKEQPFTGEGTYTYRWEDGTGSVSPSGRVELSGPPAETTRPDGTVSPVEGDGELDFSSELLGPSKMDGFFYMAGSYTVILWQDPG